MSTFYIMIGVPGSGKSTFAKTLNCKIVSTDDIREQINGNANSQENGNKVFNTAKQLITETIEAGQDVVFDAMNAKPAYRKDFLKLASNCKKVAVVIDTPLDICKERNSKRERVVPEDVIDRNYKILHENLPKLDEGFDEIIYPVKGD